MNEIINSHDCISGNDNTINNTINIIQLGEIEQTILKELSKLSFINMVDVLNYIIMKGGEPD